MGRSEDQREKKKKTKSEAWTGPAPEPEPKMDLRGMLNDNGPAASPPSRPPQAPAQQPPAQQSQQSVPSTPVQANPQQSFRDYSQTQPSPGRHLTHDYGAQHLPPGPFASPPSFPAPAANSYGRPPPPLQQVPSGDLRPASIGGGPAPSPSPYRQTPASSAGGAGGYPFPPQQNPTSPVQRQQQHPPPPSTYHRDSYPPPGAPVGTTTAGPPAAAPSYMQASHVPQTPPVKTPGAAPSYAHRSQSAQSTPTPALAQSHSQPPQYGPPFAQGNQGSPVGTPRPGQPGPQGPADASQRQSSQPPTPGGSVPLSARPAQAVGYGQPPSPHQQRLPGPVFRPTTQASPPPPPPPPPPPSLARQPNTQSPYESDSQDPHRAPQPPSDRDRSMSVSPKTRVPSLPSSSGRPSTSVSEPEQQQREPRATQQTHSAPTMADRAAAQGKRKLDDRELRPEELEKRDARPAPFENANGRAAHADAGGSAAQRPPPAPAMSQQKRKVYRTAPPWAQSLKDRAPRHPNRVLYRPVPHSGPHINGKHARQPSRHPSPEEKRSVAPTTPAPSAAPDAAGQWGPLGPWEASITNSVPQEAFSKAIADFLFQAVILNEDMGEIQSRGVKFEIEAKLGMLINKETNQRVSLPVLSECVLSDSGNWLGFRSTMTELQHKSFNEFLNQLVRDTHPANKANAALPRPRLPIDYLHRYEVDRFYDLPASVRDRLLPVAVAKPIASRSHGARVRVTYDQKTNKVLAKIVKARIADAHLHFPDTPLDCRLSVNLEMDWDGPVDELERMAASTGRPPIPPRSKDRLSYRHGCYQIDLTQVTHTVPGPNVSFFFFLFSFSFLFFPLLPLLPTTNHRHRPTIEHTTTRKGARARGRGRPGPADRPGPPRPRGPGPPVRRCRRGPGQQHPHPRPQGQGPTGRHLENELQEEEESLNSFTERYGFF